MDRPYWKGGWFGIDEPQAWKFWRSGLLITDRDGFEAVNNFVDHVNFTFEAPEVIGQRGVTSARMTTNKKSKLMNWEILFPVDGDACVMELNNSHIPRTAR